MSSYKSQLFQSEILALLLVILAHRKRLEPVEIFHSWVKVESIILPPCMTHINSLFPYLGVSISNKDRPDKISNVLIFKCSRPYWQEELKIQQEEIHWHVCTICSILRQSRKSDIFSNPRRYLDPGEWIWGDLGYSLSEHIVSPYSHAASLASEEFHKFNTAVSNIQIRAEHAIGYLKGRFQALKGLHSLIRDKDSHSTVSKMVVAMLVAHNLAIPFDDVDEYIFFRSDQ